MVPEVKLGKKIKEVFKPFTFSWYQKLNKGEFIEVFMSFMLSWYQKLDEEKLRSFHVHVFMVPEV